MLPLIFYLPESPKFLYEKGRYTELRKVMNRIAKGNGTAMPEEYGFKNDDQGKEISSEHKSNMTSLHKMNSNLTESVDQEKPFSIAQTLKSPIIIINLVICTILYVAITFDYFMISFYVKYIGGNLYINVILGAISENIAYNLGSVFTTKLGDTKSLLLGYFISIIFAAPLLVFDDNQYLIMICVFGAKFGISSVYTTYM